MVQMFFKHLNLPHSQVGQMIRIAISWTQAFIGTSQCFLTNVNQEIPPTGPSVLLELRNFLQEIHGNLVIHDLEISPLLRENDRFIMDLAIGQHRWKPQQLTQINSCRRYLQAQTLADISNLLGTRLLSHVFQARTLPHSSTRRISVFNQRRPGSNAWRTWRKFLLTLCDANGALRMPLRNWITDYTRLRHWPAFLYDPTDDQIYSHHEGASYRPHLRIAPGIFSPQSSAPPVPAQGYPTFTYLVNGTLRTLLNFTIQPTIDAATHRRYPHVFPRLQPWEEQLMKSCDLMTTVEDIRQRILIGNIISCSDGSATNHSGTFGYVISSKQGRRLIKGSGVAPGAQPNSFRSEAYGVLATLCVIRHVLEPVDITESIEVTHLLDNESVIKRIKQSYRRKYEISGHKLYPEQDVIDEISKILQALPIKINFQWVKGHQDATARYASLTLSAQLNCDADKEADQARQTNSNHPTTVTPLPHTPCQLIIQGHSVTRKIKRQVHEAAQVPKLQQYVTQKFNWSAETYAMVDWDLFKSILPKYREQWPTIVKHLHDISPTGHIAHRNNPQLPHECPACSSPQEDNAHVIQCRHSSRAEWRSQTINKVCHHRLQESDPILIDILHDGLLRYHTNLPLVPINQYPVRFHALIIAQNSIGWDQLYKGRWSHEWCKAQNHYNTQQPPERKTLPGQLWTLSFARLLIDQWLKLWKIRNEQRHGKDEDQRKQVRRQLLTAALHELYTYKDKVCPVDRHIFYPTAADHLQHQHSLQTIEDWIHTYSDAIKTSAKHAHILGITQNRAIDDYPTHNPSPQGG